MQTIHLPTIGTFEAWRNQARACLMAGQRPETLRWVMGADGGDLFDAPAAPTATDGPPPIVPRGFVSLARSVIWHSDPERFARLYALLWALRDHLKLHGTKYGCGIEQCGACTVHVNGRAVRSCGITVGEVAGKAITTIEGLSPDSTHPVQQAWFEVDVPQCGYCQTGMIMATAALLERNSMPSDRDIDRTISNICRCGTYNQVREAINLAAQLNKGA